MSNRQHSLNAAPEQHRRIAQRSLAAILVPLAVATGFVGAAAHHRIDAAPRITFTSRSASNSNNRQPHASKPACVLLVHIQRDRRAHPVPPCRPHHPTVVLTSQTIHTSPAHIPPAPTL